MNSQHSTCTIAMPDIYIPYYMRKRVLRRQWHGALRLPQKFTTFYFECTPGIHWPVGNSNMITQDMSSV
jgi:hypothetical protein